MAADSNEITALAARVAELEGALLRLRQYVEQIERNSTVRRPGPAKITPAIRDQVIALHANGHGICEIGRVLQISKTTVHKLVHGIYPATKRLDVGKEACS